MRFSRPISAAVAALCIASVLVTGALASSEPKMSESMHMTSTRRLRRPTCGSRSTTCSASTPCSR